MCQHNYTALVSDTTYQVEMGWSIRQQEYFLIIKDVQGVTLYSSADQEREHRRLDVYLAICDSYKIYLPGKMITSIAVDAFDNVNKEPRWWN